MRFAARIGQAKFPLRVRLHEHRFDHRDEEPGGRVINRDDDAELRLASEDGFPLLLQIGFRWLVQPNPAIVFVLWRTLVVETLFGRRAVESTARLPNSTRNRKHLPHRPFYNRPPRRVQWQQSVEYLLHRRRGPVRLRCLDVREFALLLFEQFRTPHQCRFELHDTSRGVVRFKVGHRRSLRRNARLTNTFLTRPAPWVQYRDSAVWNAVRSELTGDSLPTMVAFAFRSEMS